MTDDRAIRLTHPGKVLFPETGFTKKDFADYLDAVAESILPQLRDRPVTRIRLPHGVGGERFYEKNTPRGAPPWLRRIPLSASPGSGKPQKTVTYPFIDDKAGLRWAAQLAAIELHTPQFRVGPRGGVRKPDRLVIDLDPGEGVGLDECVAAARLIRARLAEDDLAAHPVTSGGKGLHLYAALPGRQAARRVHAYVRDIARELAADHPDDIVAEIGKEKRIGKVLLDWSQNHPARSSATPYTLRARRRPYVAAPREWEELEPGIRQLEPQEVLSRLRRDGDPMKRWGLRLEDGIL